jgi:hypothetical protein
LNSCMMLLLLLLQSWSLLLLLGFRRLHQQATW